MGDFGEGKKISSSPVITSKVHREAHFNPNYKTSSRSLNAKTSDKHSNNKHHEKLESHKIPTFSASESEGGGAIKHTNSEKTLEDDVLELLSLKDSLSSMTDFSEIEGLSYLTPVKKIAISAGHHQHRNPKSISPKSPSKLPTKTVSSNKVSGTSKKNNYIKRESPIKSNSDEIAYLKSQLSEIQKEFENEQAKRMEFEKKAKSAVFESQQVRLQYADQVSQLTNEITQLQDRLEEYRVKYEHLENMIKTPKNGNSTDHYTIIANLESEKYLLSVKLNTAYHDLDNAEKTIFNLKTRKGDLKNRLYRELHRASMLEDDLKQARDEVTRHQQELIRSTKKKKRTGVMPLRVSSSDDISDKKYLDKKKRKMELNPITNLTKTTSDSPPQRQMHNLDKNVRTPIAPNVIRPKTSKTLNHDQIKQRRKSMEFFRKVGDFNLDNEETNPALLLRPKYLEDAEDERSQSSDSHKMGKSKQQRKSPKRNKSDLKPRPDGEKRRLRRNKSADTEQYNNLHDWSDLPEIIIWTIFSHSSFYCLLVLSRVCVKWNRMINAKDIQPFLGPVKAYFERIKMHKVLLTHGINSNVQNEVKDSESNAIVPSTLDLPEEKRVFVRSLLNYNKKIYVESFSFTSKLLQSTGAFKQTMIPPLSLAKAKLNIYPTNCCLTKFSYTITIHGVDIHSGELTLVNVLANVEKGKDLNLNPIVLNPLPFLQLMYEI